MARRLLLGCTEGGIPIGINDINGVPPANFQSVESENIYSCYWIYQHLHLFICIGHCSVSHASAGVAANVKRHPHFFHFNSDVAARNSYRSWVLGNHNFEGNRLEVTRSRSETMRARTKPLKRIDTDLN